MVAKGVGYFWIHDRVENCATPAFGTQNMCMQESTLHVYTNFDPVLGEPRNSSGGVKATAEHDTLEHALVGFSSPRCSMLYMLQI